MRPVCVILLPDDNAGIRNLSPGSSQLAQTIRSGWSDDDLSSYRFVAIPLDKSYARQSDEYVALIVTYKNLGLDHNSVRKGEDYDWGTVPAGLGQRFMFIVIRRPVPDDFRFATEPDELDQLWAMRKRPTTPKPMTASPVAPVVASASSSQAKSTDWNLIGVVLIVLGLVAVCVLALIFDK